VKPIAKELIRFTREHSHFGFLTAMSLLLVALVTFNFYYDFEDSVIDSYTGSWLKGLWMFLYEGIPYLMTVGLLAVFGLKKDWIKKPGFWVHFAIGFGILSFDRSWYLWPHVKDLLDPSESRFIYKNLSTVKGLLAVVLPLIVLYPILEPKGKREFYGLQFKGFTPRPYFSILAVALVFIFIGGFFSDLQEYYPRYLKSGGSVFALYNGIPEWRAVAVYEFFYGLDFISTELIFRGFLILGMHKYLGPYVVYPMVVSYCVLHFGKPLTEAISSIFGGYILGVIALYHRNIWGGVIIHVGVAWGMEIIGYLHRVL
jgi:hypothetical protein